jgi:hypothetical protein
VRVASVGTARSGDAVQLTIAGDKPDLPGVTFESHVTAQVAGPSTVRFTIESALRASSPFPDCVTAEGDPPSVEFLDLRIDRIFAPHDELYQEFIYGTPQGPRRAPKMHLFTLSTVAHASFPTLQQPIEEGGYFGLYDSNAHALVVRLERLASPGFTRVCWWSWDTYFFARIDNDVRDVSFRAVIESLDARSAGSLRDAAQPVAFTELPAYRVPVFTLDTPNRFNRIVRDSSDWAWERTGAEAFVDDATGYDDACSASIRCTDHCKVAWYARGLWSDPYHQVAISGGYLLSAWVRTRGVAGVVSIGVVQSDGPETLLYRESAASTARSRPLSGTNDWTRVGIDFDASSPKLKVFLEQDGAGQSRFDNVTIEPRA